MKRVFMLSLAMSMSVYFCSASTLPVTAPSLASNVTAVAPSVAPTLTVAAPARPKATEVYIPLGAGKSVNLQELATMKAADLEKMTGKKMGWLRRMEFKLAQKKLRRSIDADGTINNKKLATLASREMDGDAGFHIGGFALGFLLGLIGVLIAYLINDDKHSNRVKWSWIGFGVLVVIILIASA